MTDYKPKLIEVALPLAAINAACAKEKTMGAAPHPQNLHRWWARRPLAAARAVLWASLVDDPSGDQSLTVEEQDVERQRLFGILEQLVKWESSNDSGVLDQAKREILSAFPGGLPPVLDPFGGGGAIPLEAQRLGLKSLAGDLNPVAVLIDKAMVEIPPRFAGRAPVHPERASHLTTWKRTQGLAADIDAYGKLLRDKAKERIGHLYPSPVDEHGKEVLPIAWIWARTVESPDPAFSGKVPLVKSWVLSKKPGRKPIWVEPQVESTTQTVSYTVRHGGTPVEPSVAAGRGGGGATCVATGALITWEYIREQSRAGALGEDLIAVVAEGADGRCYVAPSESDVEAARQVSIDHANRIKGSLFDIPGRINVVRYGLDEWWKLYTPRQLTALTTFSDLLGELREVILRDAVDAGLINDGVRLRDQGDGADAYADAVVTYLAFAIDKCAEHWCTICSWHSGNDQLRNAFSRQAVPMVWDFVEANPFSKKMASWDSQLRGLVGAVSDCLSPPDAEAGIVYHRDARSLVRENSGVVISTDPPYYDNIHYADLSDFFYVWMRRNLSDIWPDECATLSTPKADELIAHQYRAGSKLAGQKHFETGMAEFMSAVVEAQDPRAPASVYYAYKARESKDGAVRSTGWDTFLQAVVDAGLTVTATWPMRTELGSRMVASGASALASSIVLSCRPRNVSAPLASRGEFVAALRSELPEAVRVLQSGNIAPVDLAQSTIGPGIKVFSRYARVVEADGSPMTVSNALAVINDVLGEVLDGEEAELDADTRFASTWFAQHGYNAAAAGEADGLARAKNTSLSGVEQAGIGEARGGRFRVFERAELDKDWSPVGDSRLTVWEATQHLVAALERSESEAAALLHQLGGYADRARQLSYVLFQKATDNGWADEAGAYNTLITAWPTLQAMTGSDDNQQQLL